MKYIVFQLLTYNCHLTNNSWIFSKYDYFYSWYTDTEETFSNIYHKNQYNYTDLYWLQVVSVHFKIYINRHCIS